MLIRHLKRKIPTFIALALVALLGLAGAILQDDATADKQPAAGTFEKLPG